jgi:hypothetical protein
MTDREVASRKRHTKRMFGWRNQVRADGEVTDFQVRVGCAVAERVYHTADCAEVTQGELLKEVGRGTRRGLQKALHALRDRGHLRIEERNRSGDRNRYWPVIFADGDGANHGSHPTDEQPFAPGANAGSQEVRTAIRTSLLRTSDQPSEKSSLSADPKVAFERFFDLFKRRGPPAPENAFDRAVERCGDIAWIIIKAPANSIDEMLLKIAVAGWCANNATGDLAKLESWTPNRLNEREEIYALVSLREDLHRLRGSLQVSGETTWA